MVSSVACLGRFGARLPQRKSSALCAGSPQQPGPNAAQGEALRRIRGRCRRLLDRLGHMVASAPLAAAPSEIPGRVAQDENTAPAKQDPLSHAGDRRQLRSAAAVAAGVPDCNLPQRLNRPRQRYSCHYNKSCYEYLVAASNYVGNSCSPNETHATGNGQSSKAP